MKNKIWISIYAAASLTSAVAAGIDLAAPLQIGTVAPNIVYATASAIAASFWMVMTIKLAVRSQANAPR